MSALRDLFANFVVKVDTKEVEHAHGELEHAKEEAEGLGEQFEKLKELAEAFLGALAIEKIAETTEELAKEAVQLDASAAAAGLSTKAFESWQDVMQATGQDAGSLGFLIKVLERNSYEAAHGSKELAKAFHELGIEQAELKALSPEELLNRTTSALAGLDDPAKRAALGQATLGRGVLSLLPALSRGAEGLEELRGQLEEAGPAFTEEFIKQSKEAQIVAFKWNRSLEQLKVSIASYILPLLDKFQTFATKVAKAITELTDNQEKFETILQTIALVALPTLISAFGGLEAILISIRTVALETFLPFLVIAAIGLAVEDLIVFLKGGDSALGAFLDTIFGAGSAEIVLQGIHDAFKSLSDWLDQNGPALKQFWSDFGTVGIESLKGIGLFIFDAINWLGDLGESIWQFSVDFGNAFQQAINFVGGIFTAFWALINGDVDGFAQHFRDGLGALAEFFAGLFDVPAQKVHDVIDGVLDKVQSAATAAGRFVTGDFSGAASAAANIFSSSPAPQATSAGLPGPGGASGGSKVITDQRTLTVQVNSATAANAAATGREVAGAVSDVQAHDRQAVLDAVQ